MLVGRVCIGEYDGEHPCLTAATTAEKVGQEGIGEYDGEHPCLTAATTAEKVGQEGIGEYDGEHPCLTAATTAEKVGQEGIGEYDLPSTFPTTLPSDSLFNLIALVIFYLGFKSGSFKDGFQQCT